MKKVVRMVGLAMAVMAITGVATSCSKKDDKKADASAVEEKIERVRVEKVQTQTIDRIHECTAVLEGYETQNVSPSLTGIIEKRFKDVGDRVATGELLVRMDQTQLKQAKLQLANLENEMKRMDALLAGGNVTQQIYDQTKLGYDQAKEQVEFLTNNTFFKATFPGIVSARNFESGELFNGARPILTVVQVNMLKTIINLPESYFPNVKVGMKLDVISDIYPDAKFPAVIETIYPTVDAATHTFQCKVRVPNGNMKLRPGMYIHTSVNVGKAKILAVPYQSVMKLTGSNERYLFLNDNGSAKRVTVEMGQRINRMVEVISDVVADGDEVVTQGQARLVDGAKMEIMDGNFEEEASVKSNATAPAASEATGDTASKAEVKK